MAAESGAAFGMRLLLLAGLLISCTASPLPRKIALLAPFEGPHRPIGYNALYALRLCLQDAAPLDLQLLAVDDGGSGAAAQDRITALNIDPAVTAILALGASASQPAVQNASDRPLIIIGNWGHDRSGSSARYAADRQHTQAGAADDLLMLGQPAAAQNTFHSSGALPESEFYARYVQSDLHAPQPNHLASLTYDLCRLVLAAQAANLSIDEAEYAGFNGSIRFVDGYWQDAPLNTFRYENGQLAMAAG